MDNILCRVDSQRQCFNKHGWMRARLFWHHFFPFSHGTKRKLQGRSSEKTKYSHVGSICQSFLSGAQRHHTCSLLFTVYDLSFISIFLRDWYEESKVFYLNAKTQWETKRLWVLCQVYIFPTYFRLHYCTHFNFQSIWIESLKWEIQEESIWKILLDFIHDDGLCLDLLFTIYRTSIS